MEGAFYLRCLQQMSRSLTADGLGPANWQVEAAKDFIKLAIQVHDIRHVVILVRDSETGEEDEYRLVSVSCARQGQFTKLLLPAGVDSKYITLPSTSASGSALGTDLICEELARYQGKALLVSSSIDRVTRSIEGWTELKEVCAAQGHMVMSLLWDTDTTLDPNAAMRLPSPV